MKTKLLTAICVLALTLGSATRLHARDDESVEVVGDLIARPGGAVATVIGSALFVVSLPFTAPTGKVKKAADVLIRKPAWWTFKRPLGKFEGY